VTLEALNDATDSVAREALLSCGGAEAWVQRMLECRPFNNSLALHESAEAIWSSLATADWLEAFSKHPKIGGRTSAKWSAQEQAGMSQAKQETLRLMRDLNERYERKFGWIFIVCATGKSVDEMRELLEQRLSNHSRQELQIAAAEQSKIMHLRLDKLLAE
jgi:2-oxo-4-hydroxy-4-carboxy-5-ureidoimidazoline decarboxylase